MPTLYKTDGSPPVRAVLMTAKAIGLELDLVEIDLAKKDHHDPEYIKMNPQHTVPTFKDDDGFVIWDSHAIMAYLVGKYAKDDSLYPRDLKKRALIDERLYFETGVIFSKLKAICFPLFFKGKPSIDESLLEDSIDSYGSLEAVLGDNKYATGDELTIADFSLAATVSSFNTFLPIDKEKFPRIISWLGRMEQVPAYEENRKGLELFGAVLKVLLKIE